MRFTREPREAIRIERKRFGQDLQSAVAPKPRIARAIHLAMPPAPREARTSYGPSRVPVLNVIAAVICDLSNHQIADRQIANDPSAPIPPTPKRPMISYGPRQLPTLMDMHSIRGDDPLQLLEPIEHHADFRRPRRE